MPATEAKKRQPQKQAKPKKTTAKKADDQKVIVTNDIKHQNVKWHIKKGVGSSKNGEIQKAHELGVKSSRWGQLASSW